MTEEERKSIVTYRIDNAQNTLAEVLDHCERGFYNTAINRMYYACFYAASALLVANHIEAKSHEGVRQMLGKHFVLTNQIPIYLGKFYTLIFSKRSSGDYEDFINYNRQDVETLYPHAEEFVKVVKDLLPSDNS
jgi:uncharacterized protein (UPF0332 family)